MASGGKHERAIAAAAEQFMRYGFQRTTMADIARAAGMSRPALYLLFPGKEQAFEAAVLDLNRQRMAAIEDALEGRANVPDRLFTACDLWLVRVFELKCENADARDMDDLTFPVVVQVYRRLEARIAEIIADIPDLPAAPGELARVLVFAVRGLGATAADPAEMRRLTRVEVNLFCRALGA